MPTHPLANGAQKTTEQLKEFVKKIKYGILIDGIFYLNNQSKEIFRQNTNVLIKEFYLLLINKKNYDRSVGKSAANKKAFVEATTEETHTPTLSPRRRFAMLLED